MSISLESSVAPGKDEPNVERLALACLRDADVNPFEGFTATNADDSRCSIWDVPELLTEQRRDVLQIIDLFRCQPPRTSQIFPILGEAGAGKTHLLASLKHSLSLDESEDGKQLLQRLHRDFQSTGHLLLVAQALPNQEEPHAFLLRHAVDQLLAKDGLGPQLLRILGVRTTGKLLADAIRRLDPAQRLAITEARNYWESFGQRLGLSSVVRPRLEAIEQLIQEGETALLPDLPTACANAGLPVEQACQLIDEHLERNEPADEEGRFRRQVLSGLAHQWLQGDSMPLRRFLTQASQATEQQQPGTIAPAKKLLKVLLELLSVLRAPVILAFDQLEDFFRTGSRETETARRNEFNYGLASLVNHVPGICILLFAERGIWNELVGQRSSAYVTDRLTTPFKLPGQPLRRDISLDVPLGREGLLRLIHRRLSPLLKDVPGKEKLPPTFPFSEAQLQKVQELTTVRACLRALGQEYSKLLNVDVDQLRRKLTSRWRKQKQSALKSIEDGEPARKVKEVHQALGTWLEYARSQHLAEPPTWAAVGLLRHGHSTFGVLNIIRFDKPSSAGLGLGVWLGTGPSKPDDLWARLAFFEHEPARLRTLVLFHRGGDRLAGVSKAVYQGAREAGQDVRIELLTDEQFARLLAFAPWLEEIAADLQAEPEKSQLIVREIVAKETGEILQTIQRCWV